MNKKLILSTITILVVFHLKSQVNHWETALYATGDWHFVPGFGNPPADWATLNFDDSSWSVGMGGIGYGDGDDNTQIPPVASLYMRQKFDVVDLTKIELALLHADYDDAFVAYLNGAEIARNNVEGNPPSYNADALDWREAEMYNGGLPESYFFDKSQVNQYLQDGENVLAVQVHNKEGAASSDMSAIFFLSFGINDDSQHYGMPPDWFVEPGFSSHLPILTINTHGQLILDEPDIIADFGIIWNGDGATNHSLSPPNEYSGQVGIELRGSSSLFFPKNNYAIETKDAFGMDMDTSFLGFPREEDWILHGPFSDKTLMRNVLTMHLGRSMGKYASRTRYVELVLNGIYHGVYVLMEKIKRDDARVDVARLKEVDIAGDEVTGGYIFKVDRGEPAWISNFNMWNNPWEKLPYVLVYPKLEDIQPEQLDYIQSNVDSFERAVNSAFYEYGGKSYDEYIDVNSFAEHFLLSELGKNVDAYRLSSYMYKKKDSDGGKIYAGPIWDFNLAFYNADYGEAWTPDGWMYYISQAGAEPVWWNRLFLKPEFRDIINCRWQALREGPFHLDSIYAFIDEQSELLGDAIDRNFERWDILDEYIWPNPEVSGSYEGEIENMKEWIADRIAWMDENMLGTCVTSSKETLEKALVVDIYPNPANNYLSIQFIDKQLPESSNAYLTDVLGRRLIDFNLSKQQFDISNISKGIYLVVIEHGNQKYWRKIVKE